MDENLPQDPKTTSREQDPNPDRTKHLAELLHRFATNKISIADVARFPRKKMYRLTEIGHTKLKYGRFEEARDIFTALAKVDHKNYYYRSALGGVYQKMKKWIESLANYTIALKLNPRDSASLVNRGEIFLRHDKFKKAAEDFRSAILTDKVGKNLWANRARSLVIALKRSIDAKKAQKESGPPALPASRRPIPRSEGRKE
jgi:tetratricopeptide (TPR) repeat protein